MEKAAAIRDAVTYYWARATALFASKAVRVGLALAVVAAIAGYAYHCGAAGKAELKAQVRQLQEDLRQADERPAPQPAIPYWQCNGPKETRHPQCPDESAADQRGEELARKLVESEEAKTQLQRKVKDYETRLARRPAKGGAFTLSPADARSLSNVR
ncbi:hypothetical protein [Bradyrhizobium sp. DASA03007]|uniref:hypothetical protein n=1 Tax=unclassified Bradyrhizobium TaxID=2631580 RepID=UPI003F70F43C